MGVPPAGDFANIFFGIHEMSFLPELKDNLAAYCRFIDDIFGIWIGDRQGPLWEEFKKDISSFGWLTWAFLEPSSPIQFLI